MQSIFSHDRKTIVEAIEKCLDDDTMFELQNKLFSDIKNVPSIQTVQTNQTKTSRSVGWGSIYIWILHSQRNKNDRSYDEYQACERSQPANTTIIMMMTTRRGIVSAESLQISLRRVHGSRLI